MAHKMPIPTSASGAGDRRPSATQPKFQGNSRGLTTGQASESKREDSSEPVPQQSLRTPSSPAGAARTGGDDTHQARVRKKKRKVDPATQTPSAQAAFSKYTSLEDFPVVACTE